MDCNVLQPMKGLHSAKELNLTQSSFIYVFDV